MNAQPVRLLVVCAALALLVALAPKAIEVVKKKGGAAPSGKRGLAGLLPEVRALVEQLVARLEARGIRIHVGSTLRDADDQAAILERGTSATSNSWHLLGRAVDLYPIDPATGKPDLNGHNTALFWEMHVEAKRLGFRGLAFNDDGSRRYITTSKGKVWDGGHIEYRGGLTWSAALEDFRRRHIA